MPSFLRPYEIRKSLRITIPLAGKRSPKPLSTTRAVTWFSEAKEMMTCTRVALLGRAGSSAREIGITAPIVAGIMPITNPKQLTRSVAMSGTDVPQRFRAIVDYFGESPAAMLQAGIIYATEQIIDLIANGIRHIHVYTMNKPEVAAGIMQNLSEILK